MGLLDRFKPTETAVDYDAIDAVVEQTNLLMMTQSKERQAAIKKLHVGSLVTLTKTKRKGQNIYMVSDFKSGNVIGEISYGTSDYLAEHYMDHKMLGKVVELGKTTHTMSGPEVRIVYKVYL